MHSRIAILCSTPGGATSAIAAATAAAASAAPDSSEPVVDTNAAEAASAEGGAPSACRLPSDLVADACKPVADAVRAALRPPRPCRTVVEVRLGKSPKKLTVRVSRSHRTAILPVDPSHYEAHEVLMK